VQDLDKAAETYNRRAQRLRRTIATTKGIVFMRSGPVPTDEQLMAFFSALEALHPGAGHRLVCCPRDDKVLPPYTIKYPQLNVVLMANRPITDPYTVNGGSAHPWKYEQYDWKGLLEDIRQRPSGDGWRYQEIVSAKQSLQLEKQVTLVLVSAGQRDRELATRLLLPSLAKNLDPRGIVLLVIVPDGEVEIFRKAIGDLALPFPIQILADSIVFKQQFDWQSKIPGYQKQMLLKLYAAQHVSTEWYLTLDSDVYLLKKTDTSAFFGIDGKAIATMEKSNVHGGWHDNAHRSIGYPLADETLSVTPAMMNTLSCRSYINDYDVPAAIASGTTEYSLYWLYLRKMGVHDKLYVKGELFDIHRCAWFAGDIDRRGGIEMTVKHQMESSAPFSLIQSRIEGKTHLEIIDIVRKVLGF
jgi:hypothetical protein